MLTQRDLYEVLEVAKSASTDEIKKAYRKKALHVPPASRFVDRGFDLRDVEHRALQREVVIDPRHVELLVESAPEVLGLLLEALLDVFLRLLRLHLPERKRRGFHLLAPGHPAAAPAAAATSARALHRDHQRLLDFGISFEIAEREDRVAGGVVAVGEPRSGDRQFAGRSLIGPVGPKPVSAPVYWTPAARLVKPNGLRPLKGRSVIF